MTEDPPAQQSVVAFVDLWRLREDRAPQADLAHVSVQVDLTPVQRNTGQVRELEMALILQGEGFGERERELLMGIGIAYRELAYYRDELAWTRERETELELVIGRQIDFLRRTNSHAINHPPPPAVAQTPGCQYGTAAWLLQALTDKREEYGTPACVMLGVAIGCILITGVVYTSDRS